MTKIKPGYLFVVAAALVDTAEHVLLAQRPEGSNLAGLWEFPGGKTEEGETPETALVRELQEELNIRTAPEDLIPLTFASHTYEHFHLFMPLYLCRQWQGKLKPTAHQALKWVHRSDLSRYPMPEADIPLTAFLSRWLEHFS